MGRFLSYVYVMENKTEKRKDAVASDVSTSVNYDYFTICHSFVNQIKKFNELRKLTTIKPV